MELPGRSGTINEYENNSLQSADGNAEQMETSLEYNTVYEVTSMTDAKDNQESNEMMANPAYETRRYNRLFSWARKKQQVQSNNDQVYKGKPSNLLPMVLLLLLCIVACSLSVTALVVTKIEVAGLKGEIKILQEEAQNVTTTFQSLEAVDLKDPKIQQLEDNVTRLSATQQELQQEQIVLLSSLDNLTAQVNSMMNSSTRQSTSISLYQACYDDTTVCTANGNNYWSQCFTNSQPITRDVSYNIMHISVHVPNVHEDSL